MNRKRLERRRGGGWRERCEDGVWGRGDDDYNNQIAGEHVLNSSDGTKPLWVTNVWLRAVVGIGASEE